MASPSFDTQQESISSFLGVAVDQNSDVARKYLEVTQWVVDDALQLFYMGRPVDSYPSSSVACRPLRIASTIKCDVSCAQKPIEIAPSVELTPPCHTFALFEARKGKKPCSEIRICEPDSEAQTSSYNNPQIHPPPDSQSNRSPYARSKVAAILPPSTPLSIRKTRRRKRTRTEMTAPSVCSAKLRATPVPVINLQSVTPNQKLKVLFRCTAPSTPEMSVRKRRRTHAEIASVPTNDVTTSPPELVTYRSKCKIPEMTAVPADAFTTRPKLITYQRKRKKNEDKPTATLRDGHPGHFSQSAHQDRPSVAQPSICPLLPHATTRPRHLFEKPRAGASLSTKRGSSCVGKAIGFQYTNTTRRGFT